MTDTRRYHNVVKHLNGLPRLVPSNESLDKYIDTQNDYYVSVYEYNEKHREEINEKSSIAGITDVTTNRIIFDLDKKDDIEGARQDAVNLIRSLLQLGVNKNQLRCYFSGGKGFHIEFSIDQDITPVEHKNFAIRVAGNLPSFDPVVYNAARIFRIANTRHQDTGRYKIPLEILELRDLPIDEILSLSLSPRKKFSYEAVTPVHIDSALFTPVQTKPVSTITTEIDWSKKPRWLSNCRYSLQMGYFKEGMRSNALSCLAATYKNQGFAEEHTFLFLKAVCDIQAKVNNCDVFSDDELRTNVIAPVYSDAWKGGMYTCKEAGWLQRYCSSLGEHACNKSGPNEVIKAEGILGYFSSFVNDLEKNLIYTGIESLDKKIKLMVGTSSGIVGAPGCGKTALSLQLLNHTSQKGINSVFYSYDMFHAALYIRMLQRCTGYQQDKIYDIFKHDQKEKQRLHKLVSDEYSRVNFCFKAGQTIQELEETLIETEQRIGEKVKLVIVDYNELVIARSSDPTQASAEVAQNLRRIANERQVCMITLLQPSKFYSNPGEELISTTSAKGSGAIGQSMTLMLGASRPGFNPLKPEQDKYFNITCLKNRNGPLFSTDLRWDGLRGKISELEYGDAEELEAIRAERDKKNESEGF